MESNNINLIICGDMVISNRAKENIEKNKSLISDEIKEMFKNTNFVLANLEAPITEKGNPISKCGPNLSNTTKIIPEIKNMNIDIFNLANNHIMDLGEEGLKNTINLLNENNISYYGAGESQTQANKMLIKEKDGLKLAFLGMAEHEFSITFDDETTGANALSIINYLETIKKYKDKYDYLIVTLHNGAEKYPYPTPDNQKICRFLAENGADVIICQHQHRIGTFEKVDDSLVVYGQGNFIFDGISKPEWWYNSILVEVSFSKLKKDISYKFITIEQFKDEPIVKLMKNNLSENILDEFFKRSKKIKDSEKVKELWKEYCEKNKYTLISRMLGHNRLLRVLNRFTKFTNYFLKDSKKVMIRNLIETESHREAILTILREK